MFAFSFTQLEMTSDTCFQLSQSLGVQKSKKPPSGTFFYLTVASAGLWAPDRNLFSLPNCTFCCCLCCFYLFFNVHCGRWGQEGDICLGRVCRILVQLPYQAAMPRLVPVEITGVLWKQLSKDSAANPGRLWFNDKTETHRKEPPVWGKYLRRWTIFCGKGCSQIQFGAFWVEQRSKQLVQTWATRRGRINTRHMTEWVVSVCHRGPASWVGNSLLLIRRMSESSAGPLHSGMSWG